MLIYLAGPLFTAAERTWNADLASRLRQAFPRAQVLIPQEFCAPCESGPHPDFPAIFQACCEHLVRADLVVAILDGADGDSGTAWEMGFAYARSIPMIGLRTDMRPGEYLGANCMLTASCRTVVRDWPALQQAVVQFQTA